MVSQLAHTWIRQPNRETSCQMCIVAQKQPTKQTDSKLNFHLKYNKRIPQTKNKYLISTYWMIRYSQ